MLRVVTHTSAAAAAKYYAEGLKREDYYSEEQEVVGKWHGKAAGLLSVSGDVQREQFAALVENRHPVTGDKLTPRTRDGRRVGYDLNFHAPKSLSLLYEFTQDKAVLSAFRQAVSDTMTELEERAETRVRKKGAQGNRVTGNLVWAEFVHFTARPVGGIPDPHLHVHCFTFNATFDTVEKRWKAGEFANIKRDAHYAEAAFHSRLTASLQAMGYGIERKRNGWEIKGMPSSVLAKFSRRTAQIERLAEEKGITDAKTKDALGAETREGKRHGLKFSELMAAWSVRLTEDEKVQISKVCYDKGQPATARVTAAQAVDYALAKHFERQSVVPRGHLLATALRFGVGQVTPDSIKAEFEKRQLIGRKVGEDHLCTTVDVLAEEIALLGFVRNGRNSAAPLGLRGKPPTSDQLSEEQLAAVAHVLGSRDQVIAIRGAAGVGKTTLMKEAYAAIERQGHKVFAFAPSAAASRETLRQEGFAGADTVAHLLTNESLQKQVRGQVIWIDEAGLLGVRDLWRVMQIAGPSTRVILTGDTAQHAPVARGDAFRLLQKHAGLHIAEVTQIRRQQVKDYKLAVEAISKGELRTGFRRLEALGAFIEIEDDAARYRALATDYVALGKRGQFPLVVSPTHAESAKVTEAIRDARRSAGQLGNERKFTQFHNLQWNEADKVLPERYSAGLMVQFHQNAKGIKRGESFRVVGHSERGGVEVQSKDGTKRSLPLGEAGKFLVYEQREIILAKGEQIRITRNGESENGKRLNNGNEFTIQKFGKKGEIVLSNGTVLSAGHGHLAYGYCQTSHSSQSKSVRDVLIAQSEKSSGASSREQFYVSCSRGKETIRIYTDSQRQLQESVGNTSTRMAGMELAAVSQEDLSKYSAGGRGAKQWNDVVQNRKLPQASRDFAANLVEQRKLKTATDAGNAASWRGYIEMRKAQNHSSVRSSSLALPGMEARGKRVAPAQFGRGRMSSNNLVGRLAKAYRSAAEHFQKVAAQVSRRSKPAPAKTNLKVRNTRQGNHVRAAEHAARERAEVAARATQAHSRKQVEVKPAQPVPRPPVNKK